MILGAPTGIGTGLCWVIGTEIFGGGPGGEGYVPERPAVAGGVKGIPECAAGSVEPIRSNSFLWVSPKERVSDR